MRDCVRWFYVLQPPRWVLRESYSRELWDLLWAGGALILMKIKLGAVESYTFLLFSVP